MQLKSGLHVVKLLPVFTALLAACSADSGRDAGPRRVGAGGATPVQTPETPAGAPANGDGSGTPGGNEGFPDFGDVAEMPPEDSPLTPRTDCGSGPRTTVRGTIYDPAGRLPLYNVMVYVPSAELDPIVEGVSCDRCDTTASGRPVAAAITDPSGQFVMENVPDGTNIPLVIQMGKWRRQIVLPEVRPCQENAFDNRDQLRLPRNQSEGHLPRIAMTTGSADKLECLLRLIGVADAEFTTPDGPGRVNLFHETGTESLASGQTLPPATTLLGSTQALSQYDVVILSCHGDSGYGRDQPVAEKDAMLAYLNRGGRAFGSHFYFSYLRADDDNHGHALPRRRRVGRRRARDLFDHHQFSQRPSLCAVARERGRFVDVRQHRARERRGRRQRARNRLHAELDQRAQLGALLLAEPAHRGGDCRHAVRTLRSHRHPRLRGRRVAIPDGLRREP